MKNQIKMTFMYRMMQFTKIELIKMLADALKYGQDVDAERIYYMNTHYQKI